MREYIDVDVDVLVVATSRLRFTSLLLGSEYQSWNDCGSARMEVWRRIEIMTNARRAIVNAIEQVSSRSSAMTKRYGKSMEQDGMDEENSAEAVDDSVDICLMSSESSQGSALLMHTSLRHSKRY